MIHGVEVSVFLAAAGVVAGIIGTAGGITSLVAYPALLAVGVPPLTANVTCSVALIGSGASSAASAGPDVEGRGTTIRTWLPIAVLLSLAGAVVLVSTPDRVFDRIVPFLVAAGALVLLLQPRIRRWQEARDHAWSRPTVVAGLGGIAFYNGYFGAGSGILMVALLMLTREPVLHRANGMKNVILLVSDLLPGALFAVLGAVAWRSAVPLGIGAVVGGLIGPVVARRAPTDLLRVLIACCGFALAGWLLVSA
ncbi:sulfite exporter TauE/SafE family protein [Nocardioides mangrovi]|uniref:Probable membrane transporter protein n=1 Tax=Nocardioides mangrovi TaxID=2874580 RepID=A0ABS7UBM8_9ACTN|nr:sulfite exporter TauE/SafE family protein [Nocardioides mangrovi]MBZ5738277.1 sulfite exporter TauE/SafE family protein [Nocardioides mangrovi]